MLNNKFTIKYIIIAIFVVLVSFGASAAWQAVLAELLNVSDQSQNPGDNTVQFGSGLVLSSNENLIFGEINNTTNTTAGSEATPPSFILLQKGEGNDVFRVDHNGNATSSSITASGSILVNGFITALGNKLVCLKNGVNCPASAARTLGTNGDLITLLDDSTIVSQITAPYAATAGKLAANGGNCASYSYPLGLNNQGAAETCAVAPLISLTAGTALTGGTITTSGTIALDTTNISTCTDANTSKIIWRTDGQRLTCGSDDVSTSDTLQTVTNRGSITTKIITAAGLATSGTGNKLNISGNVINAVPLAGTAEVAVNYNNANSKGFTIYDGGAAALFSVNTAGDVNVAKYLKTYGTELNLTQTGSSWFFINSNKGMQFKIDQDDNEAATFTIKNGADSKIFEVDESGAMTAGNAPWARLTNFPADNCPNGITQIGGALTCAAAAGGSATAMWNPHLAKNNTITTLDSAGAVGFYTSITIGADNLPIISYADNDLHNLKVIKCLNANCSEFKPPLAIDTTHSISYNSIAIGADGLPVISYYDYANGDLRVIKCLDQACVSVNTSTAVDSANNVGMYNSIAVSSDGWPIISYQNVSAGDLKIVKCANADCSSFNAPVTPDSVGTVGLYTSIAIGRDGLPIVAYASSAYLKAVKCNNAACTSYNSPVYLDSSFNVGAYSSIAIGRDGFPVIAYYDAWGLNLKVARCSNINCSAMASRALVDTAGDIGSHTSITIGADGLPIIAYYGYTNTELKVAKCSNAGCTANTVAVMVDTTGNVGKFTSITIGTDGLPIISYQDAGNEDLKVVKCGNDRCVPYWARR